MYRLLLIKRTLEDIFIFPFILLGKLIAVLNPLKKEFRVYFFFPFYHTGGAEKVHAQVAAATGGDDCIIFFTKKSVDERFLQEFRKTGCELKDISRFTDNKWLYFLNLIYRGIISGYINKQDQKPVVFNGQCNFGYKISPWVKKIIPQVELIHSLNSFSYIRIPFLPFITQTAMISKKRIKDHLELYKEFNIPKALAGKIRYIPNAISLPAIVPAKPKETFTILFAGRDSSEKRIHLYLKIAELLHKDNQEIHFEIMGDVSRSADRKNYPYIIFHGNLSDQQQIDQVYKNTHVLLFTSSSEGFPMVVMEAMANGCAILTTAVGDIPFHIKNGENGFLFSSVENETAIINEAVEKILWLKNNPGEYEKISAGNINYANHNFGIERFKDDYRQLLTSVKQES
jgi:glycosyltransferase involved in cell wall biosynthesis